MNSTILAMKAVRIEQELIDTETTYLEGLHRLMDEFIGPIFDQNMLNQHFRKQVTFSLT